MTKNRFQAPTVYRAMQFKEPVRVWAELQETTPAHADMLRYDLAFHSPVDISLVVFPWFKNKSEGTYSPRIAHDRWRSFSMTLDLEPEEKSFEYLAQTPVGNWIGYQRPDGDQQGLEPITLNAWLAARPRVVIWGWRNL